MAFSMNMRRDEKKQMGTFQFLLTYYLCYLCFHLYNINFMDERALLYYPHGS